MILKHWHGLTRKLVFFSVTALFLKASETNTVRNGLCTVDSALGVKDGAGDFLGSFPAPFFYDSICVE